MKKIIMYTTEWCRDCVDAKKFLKERGIPFDEVNIDNNPHAAAIVMKLNNGMRMVPMLNVEGTIVSGDSFNPKRFENDLREAGVL